MGLKLSNVTLRFDGKPIVDQISFEAEDGEIVCLVGPSGCGKTTTLRILAGLELPDSGTVTLKDRVVYDAETNVPPEKRKVGLLFQDYALFPHLNVKKNINFGINDKLNREKIIAKMLETVSMEDYAEALPHMLSGGQQQRIALARALATKPDVMLLDEPFSGLDTSLRLKLRASTYGILKRNGITTIMVTHDPDEAMFMADTIVLMRAGKIEQIGSPVDIYAKPESEFCAEFFGDVCSFEGVVRNNRMKTPIGSFDAQGLSNGQKLRLLVRPESLQINPVQNKNDLDSFLYELASIHFLGEKKLITLNPLKNKENSAPISIRVKLKDKIPTGTQVKLLAKQKDILFMNPLI
jgi:iron(III) transport system ATP-binding protein